MLKTLHEKWLKCLRPMRRKQRCWSPASRVGGRAVDLGGPKFEIKHKSRRLQKSKLVNWWAKHVNWGARPPCPPLGAGPACIKKDVSSKGKTKRYLVDLPETRFVESRISIPLKHSNLGAKYFNKICPKPVQNVLKWPLQYMNFQKFSGGSCPRTLWSLFFFVFQLASN